MIPPVAWETGPDQLRQWYFDTADLIDSIGTTAWRQQWAEAPPPLPIFANYRHGKFEPGVDDDVVSAALRGVGSSDLPDPPNRLTSIRQPTLVLAWDTDPPLHPISTAERLAELIPDSTLHVAHTIDEIRKWTEITSRFFND